MENSLQFSAKVITRIICYKRMQAQLECWVQYYSPEKKKAPPLIVQTICLLHLSALSAKYG